MLCRWADGHEKSCSGRTTTTSRSRRRPGARTTGAPWADNFTEDATYIEHHYGTMQGRENIYEWITKTMAEWPNSEMKEFPHDWCVCDEERGWWICQIENRFRRSRRRRGVPGVQPHRAQVRGRHEVLVRGGRVQPRELRAGREGVDRRRAQGRRTPEDRPVRSESAAWYHGWSLGVPIHGFDAGISIMEWHGVQSR